MYAYTFEFAGVTLGAVIVIVASRKDVAERAAVKWAKENNLNTDSIEHIKTVVLDKSTQILYQWNGDY